MHFRSWAIGLFIIVGFGFFTAILFLIGNRQQAFSKHLDLYTEFSNLGGLANGAKVRVSGLDSGKLKKVEIPKGPSAKFRIELELDDKVHSMIRKDSVVSIETEGVVGDKFISIKKGTDRAEEAAAGSTLPSKEPFDLGELMERGSGMLDDVHGTVKDINGRVDVALDSITKTVNHADGMIVGLQPNIRKIANDGSQITGKIDTLVTDLNAGKGTAGLLLKDNETKQQVQTTMANVQQTSANIDQASLHANQVIDDFQKRALIAKTDATITNVQSMSQELDTTLKDALAKDNIGENGAANLRATLSNLNRSTANLAEDTEALKHNFFLRGFFKKRGFYNLDQVTPAEYLEACDRQKNMGQRKWLAASELIASDKDGQEQLSQTGRSDIDTQLAPLLNSLPGQLIVVEGYSTDGSADQQFVASRRRADLVRRYLEAHYHLRHNDVGIVALRNKPPESSGRDTWDGAAIMLLSANKK